MGSAKSVIESASTSTLPQQMMGKTAATQTLPEERTAPGQSPFFGSNLGTEEKSNGGSTCPCQGRFMRCGATRTLGKQSQNTHSPKTKTNAIVARVKIKTTCKGIKTIRNASMLLHSEREAEGQRDREGGRSTEVRRLYHSSRRGLNRLCE